MALKSALEGEDVEGIKAKTNELVQASMKLGEAMYKAQQADAANPGEIEDIPDDDAHNDEGLSSGVANLSVSADATPDLDDIPDMEEDELEEGDEAAAAPKPVAKPAGVLEARCVALLLLVFHF